MRNAFAKGMLDSGDDSSSDVKSMEGVESTVETCRAKKKMDCVSVCFSTGVRRNRPIVGVEQLHAAFRSFVSHDDEEYSLLARWAGTAMWNFERLRLNMFAAIRLLTGGDPKWIERASYASLARLQPETLVDWIAFYVIVRRVFVQQVSTRPFDESIHLDVELRTALGTCFVRNTRTPKGSGTTRIWFRSQCGAICDPSYPDLRRAVEALEKRSAKIGRLLARLILHVVRPGRLIGGSEYGQLSGSELELINAEFDLPVKTLTDNVEPQSPYAVGEGFVTAGRGARIRVGDLLAAMWGILFIAEGRHALIVTESNMRLLRLAEQGCVSLGDCLVSIGDDFSGCLFPSGNFSIPGQWAHRDRFPILNLLGDVEKGLYEAAFGEFHAQDEFDTIFDLSNKLAEGELEVIGKRGLPIAPKKLSVVGLSPLYKIAFIEFLMGCVCGGGKFSLPQHWMLDPKRLAEGLEAYFGGRLNERQQRVADNVLIARLAQFDVPGGEVACTPIAVLAIAALLRGEGISTDGIENVLIEGAGVYGIMVRDSDYEQAWLAAVARSLGEDVDLGHENLHYFAIAEVPDGVLADRQIARDASATIQDDQVVGTIRHAAQQGERFGAAITMGGNTVAVVFDGTYYWLFDSHGWMSRGYEGAYAARFDNVDDLAVMLQALVDERALRRGTNRIPKRAGTQSVNIAFFRRTD